MSITKIVPFVLISTIAFGIHAQSIHHNHKKYERKLRKTEKRLFKARGQNLENNNATPDGYWLQEFKATMNPAIGFPTPEVLFPIIENINNNQGSIFAAMPGSSLTPWVERGPNNVGGRTRALVWDPNDANKKKVWAGGVTGGLWYNNDITSASGKWTQVSTLWSNLSVTAIAFDPNNTAIMYVGTGEGYGSGKSTTRGFGVWKSTDSGKTFNRLNTTSTYYYTNDIIVRNESGSSVLYVAVDANYFGGQWNGTSSYGLFRSTNGGTSFSNVAPNAPNGSFYAISDLELGSDNTLWAGTRSNPFSGSDKGGGRVLTSTNGTTWTTKFTLTGRLGRVELACSPVSSGLIYAVFEYNAKADTILVTHNKGNSWAALAKPDDIDLGISKWDFTRGQAWYDLIMACDPNDSNTVLIGGIDLFRTTNGGSSWKQISKWSDNPDLYTLDCSFVHADQHAIAFKPGSSSTVIIGNDGGVFYTSNLSSAATTDVFSARNTGYNVTQFYWGDFSASSGSNNLLAGAQDNGTQKFTASGLNNTTDVTGGDGAYCFISQSNSNKQIASYTYNQYYYTTDNWSNSNTFISAAGYGDFINPAEWDDNGPGLFTSRNGGKCFRRKLTSSPGSLDTIVWNSSTSAYTSAMKACKLANGKSKLYVGTETGKMYVTSDAWTTSPSFNDITNGINTGYISGIYTLGVGDTVAVTLSNYGSSQKNVYYSSNGGSSWSNKEGNLPDMPIWGIVINPRNKNEAMVATEVGIYGTSDFLATTPTWSAYTDGMGAVKTLALRYRSSDQTILAVSHGRGLFTSDAWSKTSPIAAFGPDSRDVCTNKTVTLLDSSGNTPNAWAWIVTPKTFTYTNGTDSTSQNPKLRFNASGSYTVKLTVTNQVGNNSVTRNSIIKVTDTIPGAGSIVMSRNSLCEADTIMLTATTAAALNGTISTYNWLKNGNSFGSGMATQIADPAVGDSFSVVLTSTKKCVSPATFTTKVVKPIVNEVLNASVTLQAGNGCTGKPLTINSTGVDLGISPQWTWYIDGNLQGSTNTSLPIATPANGNKVWATVLVSGPCVLPANLIYSDTHTISLNTTPNAPTVSRNFDTLFANAVGSGGYIWYNNGVVAGSGKIYRAPANGNYKCVYTENGCSSDSSAVINFNSLGINAVGLGQILHPNPALDFVLLPMANVLRAEYKIYNVQGALVSTGIAVKNSQGYYKLATENLTTGIYTVTMGSDKLQQYKFVKQ